MFSMKLKSTSILIGSITALFGLSMLSETNSPPPEMPNNFSGGVKLKCNQKLTSGEMRYLFTAQATLDNGAMTSWRVKQHSPYTLSISPSLETTFLQMADGHVYIKNRYFGFEISSSKDFIPTSTLYVTKDLKNGLYSLLGASKASDFHFYCAPKI
jgi:hypothetical protein